MPSPFGALVPGMAPMAVPQMQSTGLSQFASPGLQMLMRGKGQPGGLGMLAKLLSPGMGGALDPSGAMGGGMAMPGPMDFGIGGQS